MARRPRRGERAGDRGHRGSGRQLAPLIGATYENDFRCLVKAITATHPEVRTIFEMGGENSKLIRLERRATRVSLPSKDYDTNGDARRDGVVHRPAGPPDEAQVEQVGEMVAHARARRGSRAGAPCSPRAI